MLKPLICLLIKTCATAKVRVSDVNVRVNVNDFPTKLPVGLGYLSVFILLIWVLLIWVLLIFALPSFSQNLNSNGQPNSVIDISGQEDGTKTTGMQAIWHDPDKSQTLEQAISAYDSGEYKALTSAGSTGLAPGAFWSRFSLLNTTTETQTLNIEYVDHQLITLEAYAKPVLETDSSFQKIADLSIYKPFSQRPVPHSRFVFALEMAPLEQQVVYVKFSSEDIGFVFPSMRIWQPDQLKAADILETRVLLFLFGGYFVMAIFSLVAGVTTQGKMFYAYSAYSLSKIVVWGTVLGFTHRYLVTENYSWSYMSIAGSITIFCGLVFARIALQSRRYIPKLDLALRFIIANSIFLFICGLFELNAPSVISITLALLLYPILAIATVVRWRQGSWEALVYGIAWSLLIVSLFAQAMRDMGFVAHNYTNYYWPAVASFTEMLTVMVAMGMRVRRLQTEKDQAENDYRQQLENSKAELENLVYERTKELDEAKREAEAEARTDALTGINNRRHFLALANTRIGLSKRKKLPVSLLMLDIDHFKAVNDTYGHYAGDAALLAFTKEITRTIRENDIFGRVGGEEFAILLDEERLGAFEFAERIRTVVENIHLSDAFSKLKITVSIGLAVLDEDDSIESLMNKADSALYNAKEGGRNCVMEYTSPPENQESLGLA